MPYTPPSQRSPAASAPVSPDISRRPSFQAGAPRPALPRSASYLTKHRRTPSAPSLPSNGPSDQPTPVATVEDLKGLVANPSIRQSPPPVSDDRAMPKGAIISPPESSSDEDEVPEVRGRRIENLKELHDAISQIPQHRASSPDKAGAGALIVLPPKAVTMADGIRLSRSSGALDELASQRRVSHSRSITEPNVLITKSADASLTPSEEESDDDTPRKPQMVRKKSGELVRPALRPPSRRRPSSMPGTPTFSKAVHFDSHLEHVRHFLQVDRPLAVSAGSSPVDNYDSDTEYPFNNDDRTGSRSPPYEWEIIMNNFPVETPARKAQPVRLERVWLSNDQKSLLGSVAVANLAFQKYVTCRFTLDYWKTTSEVGAEFSTEIRPRENEGHDRFNFCIKLSDLANLESKTLFFCIRYNVNGQEFWDSNGGANFQVDFRKKLLPQNGKKGAIGAATRPVNGLPRSTRRNNPNAAPRPKSMPAGMDEFGENGKLNFSQSIHDYLGESGPTSLRLKTSRSSANLPSDNLPSRLAPPSGQAFANRYDFGASLNAAVQAAKDAVTTKGDGLYMKPHQRIIAPSTANTSRAMVKDLSATSDETVTPANKALPHVAGVDSPSGSINSASYEELVNKYCFFGSKQSSPQIRDGTLRNGQFDGGDETRATNSTDSSANGSPLQVGGSHSGAQPAQHRMYHPQLHNPYFAQTLGNMTFCASPIETQVAPPRIPSSSNERASSPANAQPRSSAPAQPAGRSASPASLAGNFPPYAGTSPPNEFPYQHLHDRFPFFGADAHTATAIRG